MGLSEHEIRQLDQQYGRVEDLRRQRTLEPKVKLICNECGKTRLVSADGEYNERCPKCGGVDWDVTE